MDISWIKLKTKMFDDEKIQLIEAMPEADAILVIWIKLLIQAGKANQNGYIFLSEDIPYSTEMLATIFRRPLQIVKFALKTLANFGMIEVTNSNVIRIINWEKHQNIEGLDRVREQNRLRKAKHRNQNLLNSGKVGYCAYCNKEGVLTVDHIVPTSKGGENSAENCVLACWECNHSKTSRDLAIFLNERIMMGLPVGINSIIHNKKLTNVVSYKDGKFHQKQAISHVTVTPRHTTDIEYKIKSKNKNIEREREERDSPTIWKSIFPNKTPGMVEINFVEELRQKFGAIKASQILFNLRESNFSSIRTMKDALNEDGTIKPKQKPTDEAKTIKYRPS